MMKDRISFGKRVAGAVLGLLFAGSVSADVTVNGTAVGEGRGEGWRYESKVLTLDGAGPFVLSGTNTQGTVRVRQVSDSTVVCSNLVLTYTSSDPVYEIGAGEVRYSPSNAVQVTMMLKGDNRLIHDASSRLNERRSGIFVNHGSHLVIDDGEDESAPARGSLTVKGSAYSAAIGGGAYTSTGTIHIKGGLIKAQGGAAAAAIGDGRYFGTEGEIPGTIIIDGGIVYATGGSSNAVVSVGSPGIGGCREHKDGEGYRISINGGTVNAKAGDGCDYDIGSRTVDPNQRPVVLTGGNVRARIVKPQDERARPLRCAVLQTECAISEITGLPSAYGRTDMMPIDGAYHLWLRDGTYDLLLKRKMCTLTVSETGVKLDLALRGVTVNGSDVAEGEGEGWYYERNVLVLDGADPFVLSGTNETGQVYVRHESSSTVVLSNLCLKGASDQNAIYQVGAGSDSSRSAEVKIRLVGENGLRHAGQSNAYQALQTALYVCAGSSAEIDSATSGTGGVGGLMAAGGLFSPGIGGANNRRGGRIVINGGRIAARSGQSAAGIGTGRYCPASGNEPPVTIVINGGHVEATGTWGAGIGASGDVRSGRGCEIAINGGTVKTAVADPDGYWTIKALTYDASETVRITGGTIEANIQSPVDAGGQPLHRVKLVSSVPVAKIANLGSYGLTDAEPLGGTYFFWLPDGAYSPAVDGLYYHAIVSGADADLLPGGWPVGESVEAALDATSLFIWGTGESYDFDGAEGLPWAGRVVEHVQIAEDVIPGRNLLAGLGEETTVNGFRVAHIRILAGGSTPVEPVVGEIRPKLTGIAVGDGRAKVAVGFETRSYVRPGENFRPVGAGIDARPEPKGAGVAADVPVEGNRGRYLLRPSIF